jgi:hypothetical protein
MGFAPDEETGWRLLRKQQPACMINDIFQRSLGNVIPDPDDVCEP